MNYIVVNRIVFVLSLLGVQVTGYLTLSHLNLLTLFCARGLGCDKVAQDPLAHGLGIPALAMVPTAVFGLAFYLLLIILCDARAMARTRFMRWGLGVAQWGFALMAMFISLWLTFAEAYVIHGWCLWCLASAGIIGGIFAITTLELLAATRPRPEAESAVRGRPADATRFLAILLVALLFDGSAAFAFRHLPVAHYAAVTESPSRKSALLPAGTHLQGNSAAAYTLIEFGDYACPHCQAAQPSVEQLLAQHAQTLSYAFHYCPIFDDAGNPFLAPRAVAAAAAQGKFWEMHTRLFAQERAIAPSGQPITLGWVMATAAALGLDQARFQRDLFSADTTQIVLSEEHLGNTFKVSGVPTFFLIDPDGKIWRFNDFDSLQRWLTAPGRLG